MGGRREYFQDSIYCNSIHTHSLSHSLFFTPSLFRLHPHPRSLASHNEVFSLQSRFGTSSDGGKVSIVEGGKRERIERGVTTKYGEMGESQRVELLGLNLTLFLVHTLSFSLSHTHCLSHTHTHTHTHTCTNAHTHFSSPQDILTRHQESYSPNITRQQSHFISVSFCGKIDIFGR